MRACYGECVAFDARSDDPRGSVGMHIVFTVCPSSHPRPVVDKDRMRGPYERGFTPPPTPRLECRTDSDSGTEPDGSSDYQPVRRTGKYDQGIVLRHVDHARNHRKDLCIASV